MADEQVSDLLAILQFLCEEEKLKTKRGRET